jgi:rRNA maturation RNase YbeY
MPDRPSEKITFQNILITYRLRHTKAIRNWLAEVVRLEDLATGRIAFNFCSDKSLLEINRKFLKHDTFTDIITFDYTEDGVISGEIFISLERVRENARSFGVAVPDELHRVIVHGILHLCGYGDKTSAQKAKMTEKEDYYLSLRSF